MTLKKKIILGFLVSFLIIALLITAGYINFIEIKKEIRYLELSDTLRSKSLQLRRHEKNFFLYRDSKHTRNVHTYIKDIKKVLKESETSYDPEILFGLENKIREYEKKFNRIESLTGNFQKEFSQLKQLFSDQTDFSRLTESTFLESPLVNADILKNVFSLEDDNPAISSLHKLSRQINALRKTGEELLFISNEIDKSAREKLEKYIGVMKNTVLFLFPLFLIVGLGSSFAIGHSIVKRLKILTGAIKKTGKGEFSLLAIPEKQDEVGELIKTFNEMEYDLVERDYEIKCKNEELLLSKKLASLGTLASGVAHELNNPLNNVYLAAQTLSKQIDPETSPGIISESVKDVFSQSLRMKRIVSDLLEYSRQRAPESQLINLVSTVENLLHWMKTYGEMADVKYDISGDKDIEVRADKVLMQQVFINLCGNAVDAMDGDGTLTITINMVETCVQIKIADTGKGINSEDIPKIFDPFFTKKEKGTGLGLAIVYSIIERHHGKIEVQSEPDKGTSFIITLPGE